MAKSAQGDSPTVVVEATEAAVDVAAAIDKERRRLERGLAKALRALASRLDQLVAAEESNGRKAIAKRRRQADDAATKVAELTDKLTILAGTGVDAAATTRVAGSATRSLKPTDDAGTDGAA